MARKLNHKKKPKGSIRVYRADIFYEPALIDKKEIDDGVSKAYVNPACVTNDLRVILNRHSIKQTPTQVDGEKLKKQVEGLNFESIKVEDADYLRIKYSAWNTKDLADTLEAAMTWLKANKIKFGESNGDLFCSSGCYDLNDLRKMQKQKEISE